MTRRRDPRALAEAYRRQEERRALTLARLAEWPEGMPPIYGSGIGPLVALEGLGLAQRLPQADNLGHPRFVLTDAGRRQLERS